MAFLPGLKKQINKVREGDSTWKFDFLKILLQANQFMSERISGVEGTKLDDDFHR